MGNRGPYSYIGMRYRGWWELWRDGGRRGNFGGFLGPSKSRVSMINNTKMFQ